MVDDILLFLEWMKSRIDNLIYDKGTIKSIKDVIIKIWPIIEELKDVLQHVTAKEESSDDFFDCFQILRNELNDDDAINGSLQFIEELLIIILQSLKHFHNFLLSESLVIIENQLAQISMLMNERNGDGTLSIIEPRVVPMPSARDMKDRFSNTN